MNTIFKAYFILKNIHLTLRFKKKYPCGLISISIRKCIIRIIIIYYTWENTHYFITLYLQLKEIVVKIIYLFRKKISKNFFIKLCILVYHP